MLQAAELMASPVVSLTSAFGTFIILKFFVALFNAAEVCDATKV